MIASQNPSPRDTNLLQRIDAVLCAHHTLAPHRPAVRVSIEDARIVLRGNLPSAALKQELVPAIRLAGVLGQVCNCVEVN